MKKFLLATLIGTSLMTTFAGASSAFALTDENKEQKVKVSYTSTAAIATAEYTVAIPTALTISSDTKESNFTINLYNQEGKDYSGNKKIKISVKSANEFSLTGNSVSTPYLLSFDGIGYNGENQSTIELNQTKKSIVGLARVKAETIKPGSYSDVLTFKVESDNEV